MEEAARRRSHWLGWIAMLFTYLASWAVSLAVLLFFAGLLALALPAYLPLSYFVARSAQRRDFWENAWRTIPSVLLMAMLASATIGEDGGLTPVVVSIAGFFIVSGAGIGGWAMTEVMFPEEQVGQ